MQTKQKQYFHLKLQLGALVVCRIKCYFNYESVHWWHCRYDLSHVQHPSCSHHWPPQSFLYLVMGTHNSEWDTSIPSYRKYSNHNQKFVFFLCSVLRQNKFVWIWYDRHPVTDIQLEYKTLVLKWWKSFSLMQQNMIHLWSYTLKEKFWQVLLYFKLKAEWQRATISFEHYPCSADSQNKSKSFLELVSCLTNPRYFGRRQRSECKLSKPTLTLTGEDAWVMLYLQCMRSTNQWVGSSIPVGGTVLGQDTEHT